MTIPCQSAIKRKLALAFPERPTLPLDMVARQERRRRVVERVQTVLARYRPTDLTWGRPQLYAKATAMLAMAAGIALVLGWPQPKHARPAPTVAFRTTEWHGRVLCDRDDGRSWSDCDPSRVRHFSGLKTLPGARVIVETAVGVRLDLAASSTLWTLDSPTFVAGSRVTVTEGRLDVTVPRLGPDRQFSVVTPSATITVHGTAFTVEVSGPDAPTVGTCVRLREGRISIESLGHDEVLVAPATWGCSDSPSDEKRSSTESGADAFGDETEQDPVAREDLGGRDRTGTANPQRSNLAREVDLLQRALGAERHRDLPRAEKSLRRLLLLYPNSVVAPEARAALTRIVSKQRDGLAPAIHQID